MDIKLSDILKIPEDQLNEYKLHLACWNGEVQPLDVYLENWDEWVGWNEWKGNKNDFTRKYIFSLIQFYHEDNKWLFGGIFEVIERHEDYYELELKDIHKELIGRLVIDFYRYQGMRGRAFYLENYYESFMVSEVLKKQYDGVDFPGYENINIDFPELEQVFRINKNDWKGALENVKGVYVITDKSNGKKYVGSAYGDFGVWSRWAVYIGTGGHGFNDELTKIIMANGIEYARANFRFCLLEYRSMKTDDSTIINRESYWKNVFLSRGEYGYNRN
jgi:hypothetical protein